MDHPVITSVKNFNFFKEAAIHNNKGNIIISSKKTESQSLSYILKKLLQRNKIQTSTTCTSSSDEVPAVQQDNNNSSLMVSNESNPTCPICLEVYEEGEEIVWSRSTECNHVFHLNCMLSWLMLDNNDECPMCRRDYLNLNPPSS